MSPQFAQETDTQRKRRLKQQKKTLRKPFGYNGQIASFIILVISAANLKLNKTKNHTAGGLLTGVYKIYEL